MAHSTQRTAQSAKRRAHSAKRTPHPRRGIVLLDAIIGGVVLGIGLSVVISLAGRSLSSQAEGERMISASWLLDELLAMVVVEGPDVYLQMHETSGQFDAPFDGFYYEVEFDDLGERFPYRVTAAVRWPSGFTMREARAQTYVARRLGDPVQLREPLEPVDREARYYDDEADE
jgi:hypothetical protein